MTNPKILIFDDSLSAIDSKTESNILQQLKNISYKSSIIFITHRVATAMNADKIIILNKGEIVEQGAHLQLLRKGGFYTKLHSSQT